MLLHVTYMQIIISDESNNYKVESVILSNGEFQYFLNQHSNVYLEKDDVKRSVHVNTIFVFANYVGI